MKTEITHKACSGGEMHCLLRRFYPRSKQKVMIGNHALITILVGNALLAGMK